MLHVSKNRMTKINKKKIVNADQMNRVTLLRTIDDHRMMSINYRNKKIGV